jgi:hypothetical protein
MVAMGMAGLFIGVLLARAINILWRMMATTMEALTRIWILGDKGQLLPFVVATNHMQPSRCMANRGHRTQ